jgi:ADP-sugar diphosphatase
LLVLKTEKTNHPDQVIFTLQPRVPVPAFQFPELPAGMLDGSGQFAGKAAEEIKEETGQSLAHCLLHLDD